VASFYCTFPIQTFRSVAVSPDLPSWRELIADASAGRRAFLRTCLRALGLEPVVAYP
jgi:hypothetical protein